MDQRETQTQIHSFKTAALDVQQCGILFTHDAVISLDFLETFSF